MQFDYIIPIIYTPQSNETFINKRVYIFEECDRLNQIDKNNLWNFNLCPQDNCYCQLYVKGDKIYLQYKSTDPTITHVISQLLDNETDTVIDIGSAVTTQQGIDANKTNFFNIVIDTTDFAYTSLNCFYVRLSIYRCTPDEVLFAACIATKIGEGKTATEADYECWEQFCAANQKTSAITEPFCPANDCNKTILITGDYTKYDCNGNFYGTFADGSKSIYKAQLRIYGEVFKNNYTFEETLVNRHRSRSRMIEKYTVLSNPVPPYIADQMAVCWNSKTLKIDSISYIKATELSKNFDEGNMWIIKTELNRECNEIDFTCD
jgi:hypothetical protein